MDRMSFLPKPCRDREWLDLFASPPSALVAAPVKLTMVEPADWDGEAVAHLASHCLRLSEFDVVGIGGASTANETRLRSNKFQMIAVALAHRLTDDGDGFGLAVASSWVEILPIRLPWIRVGSRCFDVSEPLGERAVQGLGIWPGKLIPERKNALRPGGKGLGMVKLIEL